MGKGGERRKKARLFCWLASRIKYKKVTDVSLQKVARNLPTPASNLPQATKARFTQLLSTIFFSFYTIVLHRDEMATLWGWRSSSKCYGPSWD